MGTYVPQTRSAISSLSKMSVLWKLCVLVVIFQAASVNSVERKLRSTDLRLDDTFDIDQDTNEAKWIHDLDEKTLRDDELQPIEADTDADEYESNSWLQKSVRRVRRELSRIFAASENKASNKKGKKRESYMSTKNLDDKSAFITNKSYQKRNSLPEQDYDGSGSPYETADDTQEPKESWQTKFIINEPWTNEFINKSSYSYRELSRQLEMELIEIFRNELTPDVDDDDVSIRVWLSNVLPTQDYYKIYVVVEVLIPARFNTFGDVLKRKISDYHRLINMGAEIDNEYYFKNVRESYEVTSAKPVLRGIYRIWAQVCDEVGFFTCQDESRIACEKVCNNVMDCNDESDEAQDMCGLINPDGEETETYDPNDICYNDEFTCLSKEVIPCSAICDSASDCSDGSDESENLCKKDVVKTFESDIENLNVNDVVRIANENESSGADNIPETTDSYANNDCRGDVTFSCYNSNSVVCGDQRCDGYSDCPDNEDELDCGLESSPATPSCSENEFMCDERCLPREYQCNGIHECIDNTDEINCPPTKRPECGPNEYRCSSGDCIDIRKRCDRHRDCPDEDDEDDSCPVQQQPEDCASDQFFCDYSCRPYSLRCNGQDDCADRTDEENCDVRCPEYTCPNGRCFAENERCNGFNDCDDGFDEQNCCTDDQFRCRNGECISSYYKCNNVQDCNDGSDEEGCPDISIHNCLATQFRCQNGQCINAVARCDGQTDCYDSSDELYCPIQPTAGPELNLTTIPNSQIIKESNEVVFRCRDVGPLRAKVRWSRPGGLQMPAGFKDINGRLEIPNIRFEDAGTYICEAVGYPRHIPGQQVSVDLTVERFKTISYGGHPACSAYQATCQSGECIDKKQICDDIPHCSDGSDEHSCSHGRKCQPNQFLCHNSKCVDRIWRCDGENDCGDNSDEESCDDKPSGPCRYDEFQCRSGHCIPKSFQCDDTNDCDDATDEIGCMPPVVIRRPTPLLQLPQGGELNLTCVATGVPTPEIVWRLNWGHVPEKCVSKSYGGTGTLYCADMEIADSGAYSCEIVNSKGTHFVTPDSLVTVDGPPMLNVCPAGFFNMLAQRREDCINCFCFGVSHTCHSANLYNFAIQPPITSQRVVNVALSSYDVQIREMPASNIITLHHGVQFRASNVPYNTREAPYLALPSDYMGNQLKSYGGFLRYDVNYLGTGRPTQVLPDVIIMGNRYNLVHRSRMPLVSNENNRISVQFVPGPWNKPDGRMATREEIMMVLANVENILIRLNYIDGTEREVELTNILMDSAGLEDHNLGSASLVEQCKCPIGHVGDSCESCAPGYEHQRSGPWLGRCVPVVVETCPHGTYGDPRRGIACRECPCPQTGANNFANGCQMAPDGDVVCKCREGYAGRRCEVCAPGYQGNPMIPGVGCIIVPENICNSDGTLAQQNGECNCKQLVVGEYCDTCAAESFHLNSFTFTGCIECFCSGLTKQCSSSTWYRDQISSNFGFSRAPHGFNLIQNYETNAPINVAFSQQQNALQFSQQSNSEPLYWSLPSQFLGDQITAYGGKLNYTLSYNPLPGGLMSRNNAPDVVIKSGDDLTLIHYRKSGVNPSQSSTYAVRIIESEWQRLDGQVVNREHLLMALSKINAIYIKATYTTSTKSGALTHVSLDIAKENNIGTARALEVEQCRCPPGYDGLSCERCSNGYTRKPEAGIYFGLCEPCKCNNHSDQCDPETGVCYNCDHNTEGNFCDRCAPGYNGNAQGGTAYDCSPNNEYIPPVDIYKNLTYCRSCDQAGTVSCDGDYCNCKSNVQGNRCDQCRPGTFDLSENNVAGCKECYCSGRTLNCRSSALYRYEKAIDFFSYRPIITDEEGIMLENGRNVSFDMASNTCEYYFTAYEPIYWSLRGPLLGNQLNSYGGTLSYELEVESYNGVGYEISNDIILIGNGIKLSWSRPVSEQNNPHYRVRLHEDEKWVVSDRGYAQPASRSDIMNVLSNLEHILLRANTKRPSQRTIVKDIILESAIPYPTVDARVASEIEICSCPSGYTGNSCENCEPLYYNDNGCQPCPCEEDTTESCYLHPNSFIECQCKPGYSGDRCQNEYIYTPPGAVEVSTPTPVDDYKGQITVSIARPDITILQVGSSLTLSCSGRFAWNNYPVFVKWYKLNGELPLNAEISAGILQLYDLQIYDSGVYICEAVNNQTSNTFRDEVSITITEHTQRTPAHIIELPQMVQFEEYVPNEIDCVVEGNPPPTVTWTRLEGQMSHEVRTDGSRLLFPSPRRSDQGNYRCHASNEDGQDQRYIQIAVHPAAIDSQPPQREYVLYIEPQSYSGQVGDSVRFACHQTTASVLEYVWAKDSYPLYNVRNIHIDRNVLELRDASTRDAGIYTCIGIDQRGRRNYTADVRVDIDERQSYPYEPIPQPGQIAPTIKSLPQTQRILQGQDFTVTCEATGSPYPKIRWTKLHEALPDNVHQSDNVMRILNASPANRGMYVCIAENSAGTSHADTYIDVEPREHPIVDIYPLEPQTIRLGEEAVLYCSASGIPSPTLKWRRLDNRPLSSRHTEKGMGNIIIENVQLNDTAEYECVAENEVGRSTASTSIRVIEIPTIRIEPNKETLFVREGSYVKVACMARGEPAPSVQWVSENQNTRMSLDGLQQNQATLEINRFSSADSQTYKCIASNEAGISEEYIRIEVWDNTRGDVPEDIESSSETDPDKPFIQNVNAGEDVTISCDINNDNTIPIRWERVDGRDMGNNVVHDRNRLIISNVEQQNAGIYRCNMEGTRGYAPYKISELRVIPLPLIIFEPEMPLVVRDGDNVEINCKTIGESPIRVTWHTENDRPLPSSVYIHDNFLRFESITPADAGRYYCSASNRYGETKKTAEVIVNRRASYIPEPLSQKYNIREGSNVNMNCEIPNGGDLTNSGLRFEWSRDDNQPLPSTAYKYSQVLSLYRVRPEEAGRYVCSIYSSSNRLLDTQYAVLQITREYPYPRIG